MQGIEKVTSKPASRGNPAAAIFGEAWYRPALKLIWSDPNKHLSKENNILENLKITFFSEHLLNFNTIYPTTDETSSKQDKIVKK